MARLPKPLRPVVILSHSRDAHVPLVTKHLDASDTLLIDPVDVLEGKTVDYAVTRGKMICLYRGRPLNPRSIWVRRPTELKPQMLPVAKDVRPYAHNALSRHLQALLFVFPEAFWMSSRAAIVQADVKSWQLQCASRVGFRVPETLMATSADQARAFVNKHRICVAKSAATILPRHRVCFTKIVRKTDRLDFSGLHLDSYIFQKYIEPLRELRVAVVGNEAFASVMEGQETDGVSSSFRDYRVAFMNQTFVARAVSLPRTIEKCCVTLVRELGLAFGAIDLIVDKQGRTWFLEVNPNGQWAFVEEETQERIARAIARKLERGTEM